MSKVNFQKFLIGLGVFVVILLFILSHSIFSVFFHLHFGWHSVPQIFLWTQIFATVLGILFCIAVVIISFVARRRRYHLD